MFVMLSAAVSAIALSVSAQAATITYSVTGTASGVVGAQAFDGQEFSLIGIGDTDGRYFFFDNPETPTVPLSSLAITIGGAAISPTGFFELFNARAFGLAGLIVDRNRDAFDFLSPALSAWENDRSFGPIAVQYAGGSAFNTDAGILQIASASNLVFSAVVANAVPEPATWAMMIGGFGLAGGALRHRKRPTATFA